MGPSFILYIHHRRRLFHQTLLIAYKVSSPGIVWSRDASWKHLFSHVLIFSKWDEDQFLFVPKWFTQHFWLCTTCSCPSAFLQALPMHALAPCPAAGVSRVSRRLYLGGFGSWLSSSSCGAWAIPSIHWAFFCSSSSGENELCFLELHWVRLVVSELEGRVGRE